MQKLVFINGNGNQIDLTAGNFGITNWSGLSNTGLNIQTQQVPFEDGAVFLDALMEQREISVTVAIYDGNNLELRYQKKRELISALNPKLGEGTLIYTNDYLSRQIKAVPQIPLFENKNSNDAGTLKASVSFSCPSPYWEDLEETEIELINGYTTEIENNGDNETAIKVNTDYGTNNFNIINDTTKKVISIKDAGVSPIEINTGIGQKSVVSQKGKFDYYAGGRICSVTQGNGITIITLENGIIVINVLGEKKYIEHDGYNTDVIFKNGKFYVISANAIDTQILITTDGEAWDSITLPKDYLYIKYLFNCFIVYKESTSDGKVVKSTDGITWNEITVKDSNNNIINPKDFLYDGGKWQVLSATKIYTSSTNNFSSCQEKISLPFTFGERFAYGNGIYVIGSYNSGVLASTVDGSTFNTLTDEYLYRISSVAFNNGQFLVSGAYGVSYKSTDGINWTPTNLFSYNVFLRNKAESNYFLLYSENGALFKSNDLEDWQIILPSTEYGIEDILKLNDFYIIVGSEGICKGESLDSNFILKDPTIFMHSVAYANGKIVAVGDGGVIKLSIDNGENWTSINSGVSTTLNKVIYSEEKELFCILGNNGVILTSPDGENWTSRNSGVSSQLNCIAYGNGTFIVGSGVILKSTNLIDWESVGVSGLGVAYGNGIYIVFGNPTYTSKDLINWNPEPAFYSSSNFKKAYFYRNVFFVVENYKVYITYDGVTKEELEVTYMYQAGLYFENNLILLFGEYGRIDKYVLDKASELNIIDKLTTGSQIDFYLQVGINRIKINTDGTNAVLKYRQKYIGV